MATDEKKTNATVPASGADELTKVKEELKQSKGEVADLTQKVSDLQGTIISPQYQEFMKAQNQPATFQPTEFAAGRSTGKEEVDLEMLDNKQLVQHMMGEFNKQFGSRIDQVSQNVRQDQLQRGIKDAKGKHKDFDNFKVAMGKTAARLESGNITAEDVYKIESWKSPTEAGTEDKDDKTIVSEKPTTGGDAPTDVKQLTLKESAEKLWEDKGIDEKFPPPKQ